MGAQKNRLIETVLLSTHNICFGWEIRKLVFCYAFLTKGLQCYVFTLNCVFCVNFRYVSLSDNEKTGFKARELKSVQVDAVGNFLKLNIHKNHINKYNLYNQVRSKRFKCLKWSIRNCNLLYTYNWYDSRTVHYLAIWYRKPDQRTEVFWFQITIL